MLDIGLSELLIILGVALIVLGPQKLPELARAIGRGLAEFRRASEDLRRSVLLEDDIENEASYLPRDTTDRKPAEESSAVDEAERSGDPPQDQTHRNDNPSEVQSPSRDEG